MGQCISQQLQLLQRGDCRHFGRGRCHGGCEGTGGGRGDPGLREQGWRAEAPRGMTVGAALLARLHKCLWCCSKLCNAERTEERRAHGGSRGPLGLQACSAFATFCVEFTKPQDGRRRAAEAGHHFRGSPAPAARLEEVVMGAECHRRPPTRAAAGSSACAALKWAGQRALLRGASVLGSGSLQIVALRHSWPASKALAATLAVHGRRGAH